MPVIDDEQGTLVLRVVYDGAPLSGKTTTLRTLASGLGVEVTTPDERDGRTLFFDWVDYVGGIFEGRQIRCQIVSVPGQVELGARRRALLEDADAIVLVADTTAPRVDEAYRLLRELRARSRTEDPPVGIVMQANKRDAPDCVPRREIVEAAEAILPVAVVETVATSGEGVRECFVFAVRLALDRVRALADAGQLHTGRPDIDDPSSLLQHLNDLEEASGAPRPRLPSVSPPPNPEVDELEAAPEESPRVDADPPGADAESSNAVELYEAEASEPSTDEGDLIEFTEGASSAGDFAETSDPLASEPPTGEPEVKELIAAAPTEELPFRPDPNMPGGFIWPPVDGRMLLHEISQLALTPVRTPAGDWIGSGEGWRFHSTASAIFDETEPAREALIEWARLHATHLRVLSEGRSVILADAGPGRYRLWQLVRVVPALRERLEQALDASPSRLAADLHEAAEHLLLAREALHRDGLVLRCSLWSVRGDLGRPPVFVDLMPAPSVQREEEPWGDALLDRELRPILRSVGRDREDLREVRTALEAQLQREPTSAAMRAVVAIAETALAR